MKPEHLKKDIVVIAAVGALALAAFFVSRRGADAPAPSAGPYRPAAEVPIRVHYRAAGGLSPLAEVEVDVRGPGADDCVVRWRAHGGPAIEKRLALGDRRLGDLLARLGRADFFEVDEVPRSGYIADLPATALAYTVGDRTHEVVVDGRRRASRDLRPVYEFFEEIRKQVTPEPVSSGD